MPRSNKKVKEEAAKVNKRCKIIVMRCLKCLSVFLILFLVSVLGLLVTTVPIIFTMWQEFQWREWFGSEAVLAVLFVCAGFAAFLSFMIVGIKDQVSLLKQPVAPEFKELDQLEKKKTEDVYTSAIAKINCFYSDKGNAITLLKEGKVDLLLARSHQLQHRANFASDVVATLSAFITGSAAGMITNMNGEDITWFNGMMISVITGLTCFSLFFRPMYAKWFQSKYDADLRIYEMQKIDELLRVYNENSGWPVSGSHGTQLRETNKKQCKARKDQKCKSMHRRKTCGKCRCPRSYKRSRMSMN